MNRNEAFEVLAREIFLNLSEDNKIDILTDFWFIYEDENNYNTQLLTYLEQHSPEDVETYNSIFDPIIIDGLKFKYRIFNNKYLAQLLNIDIVVGNEKEGIFKCPCCNFYSLDSQEGYDVCAICLWEDVGSNENNYSSINRSALDSYRINFLKKNNKKGLMDKYIHDD